MDFVVGGGGGGNGGLGSENGPILYSESNRTSAIDDIRSVVIYVFIITLFLAFFLILPGIRYDKFPTFLCITASLIVTSIILIALFGTSWHVGDAPISAAYKAFSRDRIQGELSVKIGLQSVNITLRAHKYYILHATHGPIIMDNSPIMGKSQQSVDQQTSISNSLPDDQKSSSSAATLFINQYDQSTQRSAKTKINLADELLGGRTSDGTTVDTELEVEEVFASPSEQSLPRKPRSSSVTSPSSNKSSTGSSGSASQISKRSAEVSSKASSTSSRATSSKQWNTSVSGGQKYTIKRVNVDINYNERFYWIEPNQMRQEHHNALERGLPYPILTVVEYLSQDAAGFSWSRQYRMAGYYSYIILWLSLCVCVLMFFLHCAAPKYGIYTMQILGCLLLLTNFTYAILVPRGEQKLVIPFEGQSLSFSFGWNFWAVLIGGCISLVVGTFIVIIDSLFPNFIFTTILDVDFDSHNKYYKHRMRRKTNADNQPINALQRPIKPPFFDDSTTTTAATTTNKTRPTSGASSSSNDTHYSKSTTDLDSQHNDEPEMRFRVGKSQQVGSHGAFKVNSDGASERQVLEEKVASRLSALFVDPSVQSTSDNELRSTEQSQKKQDSSIVEMNAVKGEVETREEENGTSDNILHQQLQPTKSSRHHQHHQQQHRHQHHYSRSSQNKNSNLNKMDHQSRRQSITSEKIGNDQHIRL